MPFTITKNLERLPSYQLLCTLAEQNQVRVTGNEGAGSFMGRGVEGEYEFSEDCLRGKFEGHGVAGEFCFKLGQLAVTINNKPFWLPETLLKQKLTEALDTLGAKLA